MNHKPSPTAVPPIGFDSDSESDADIDADEVAPDLALSTARRISVTASLLTGTFLASLDVTVVATAMPQIASELSGVDLYGGVFAAYLLAQTTTMPLYGKLADRWGRRTAFTLGISLLLLGSLLCALSPTMMALVASRLVQGAGAGAIVPLTVTMFGDLYDVATRARLQAVASFVWGVSSIVGPIVGAALVEIAGWPSIFYLNLPVGAVALIAFNVSYRVVHPRAKSPVDVLGAALLAVSIVSALIGSGLLDGAHLGAAVGLLGLSAIVGYLFVRVERRAQDPVVPLGLFADPVLSIAAATSLFVGGLLLTFIAYVPLLVRGVGGGSMIEAGVALIPLSFAWTIGSFLSARIILRYGYRPAIRLGTALSAIGAVGVAVSTFDLLQMLIPASVSTGLGLGLTVTGFNVVTQDRVAYRRRGAASAMLVFSRSMGGTVIVSLLGLVLATTIRNALAGPVAADTAASDIIDPARWADVDPAALAVGRAAVATALRAVFGAAAASAVLAFVIALRFPAVRVGELGAGGAVERAG